MLISDYLRLRGNTALNPVNTPEKVADKSDENLKSINSTNTLESSFAKTLQSKLQEKTELKSTGVEFSKHALERLNDRRIDLRENGKLDRLNKAVEIAAEKGSNDTLVLVDSTAFVVSVKNNKVITTLSQQDLQGNIFTNIDSTVIM